MTKAPNRANDTGAFNDEQGELFDKPALSAVLPSRTTLAYLLLNHFLEGGAPTQPDWFNVCPSWRLSATVKELKYLGWPVVTLSVPAPSESNPARTIARYVLPSHAVTAAAALMKGGAHAG